MPPRPALLLLLLAALAGAATAAEAPGDAATWLAGLAASEVTTPHGMPFSSDGSRPGGRIAIAGVVDCSHSLFAHAPSHVAFRLGGKVQLLAGAAAIDGAARIDRWVRPDVVFRILGDGRELWTSGDVGDHTPRAFAVDVAGVDKIELIADAPKGPSSAQAVWIEPRLVRYGKAVAAAQQTAKRAVEEERSGRLGKALDGYDHAARAGGDEPFAQEAHVKADELRERRRAAVAEAMARIDRGDRGGALAAIADIRKAWGDADDLRALAAQAR